MLNVLIGTSHGGPLATAVVQKRHQEPAILEAAAVVTGSGPRTGLYAIAYVFITVLKYIPKVDFIQ
jgi:hypothetical protein